MGDLKRPVWMVVKAVLLAGIGVVAAVLLWMEAPTLRTAGLIAACVWGFSRAYYFCFYVIEKYIDPGFRFAGLFSVLKYAVSRKV